MIAILRQLEVVHGVKPNQDQQKAEATLEQIRDNEEQWLQQTVREEEQEAGLSRD